MTRSEFVRRLVLDSICDDYENVDQVILRWVEKTGAKCGLTIERSEVVDALASLIADGLAKAYILSGYEPHSTEIQSMPQMDVIEEHSKTYFYITKKGMDLHLSDCEWPLDDEGELRKDWAVRILN